MYAVTLTGVPNLSFNTLFGTYFIPLLPSVYFYSVRYVPCFLGECHELGSIGLSHTKQWMKRVTEMAEQVQERGIFPVENHSWAEVKD